MHTAGYSRIATTPAFHDAGHGFDVFGFHPPTLAAAVQSSAPIYERYFRVDSLGAEHVPATGPAIVIANHAGVLPVDGAMLCLDVLRHTERIPRPVSDYFVFRWPLVSTLFARLGVVNGTRPNVRALLDRDELLVIFPEGASGTAKRFASRYHIQRWSVGFAELAIRHRVPVIPVAIIGAEESWPLLGKLRLHAFGSPYVPIPATPLPLPAHYHIRYGSALRLDEGLVRDDADNPRVVAEAAERARHALEHVIRDARDARRGVFR